jgi:TfoX C-terminal domain
MEIANCRNLGARSAEWLALVGVHTLDDLAGRGPVQVYLDLKDAGIPGTNRVLLWAMEGALTDTDWRAIPLGRKDELLSELERAARG